MRRIRCVGAAALLSLLAACGGNDEPGGAAPPPPPPASGIGAAGGTVSDPSGAKVVVPGGALTTDTAIAVAPSATGSPALPANVTAIGEIFAFTPHGTSFAKPATITVPFDPAKVPAGATLALYKTDATQSAWQEVSGATVKGNTMEGAVSGFSFATVVQISQTPKSWHVDLYNKASGDFVRYKGADDTHALEQAGFLGTTTDTSPATYWIHSTENGGTFWTQAVAPLNDPDSIGIRSALTETFYFRADRDFPTLSFLITHASLVAFDDAGALPNQHSCPWLPASPTEAQLLQCAGQMTDAFVAFSIVATGITNHALFYRIGGELQLSGRATDWRPLVMGDLSEHELFYQSDFEFDDDANDDGQGRSFLGRLREPKRVELPIGSMRKGDIFSVQVFAKTQAINRIQGESLVGALLQDPLDNVGVDLETDGLTQLPPQDGTPASAPILSCSTSPEPEAGTLAFARATFADAERSGRAVVIVERTGGTVGDVGVRVQSADASAAGGSDFEPVSAEVRFADGEAGQRRVEVSLLNDAVAEDNETVNLALTDVGGCAQLGPQATATLTIFDDDRPIATPATFTVGGSISGLAGGGLVLHDRASGQTVNASGNSFTLPVPLNDGSNYDIAVTTQPTNPLQSCSVAHGSGTVSGADVTDIPVTCVTPLPSGSLDPDFGDAGRVATAVPFFSALGDGRIGLALQPDGKILMVGGLKLLRFDTDGTLDATFGTAGVVDVVLNNGSSDTTMDIAVQADGKILVAGTTSTFVVGSDDFALTRYNADGTLDTTFGTGGHAITDFFGSTDRARRIELQADGKILVVGSATQPVSSSTTSVVFAIARYDADGAPDTSFSGDGRTTDSPFGSFSVAYGVAIQGDGKIVLAGSTANNGVDDPDSGFVRYLGAGSQPGTRDLGFGPTGNGTVHASLGDFDQVVDVVVPDDGVILGAVQVDVGAAVGGRAMAFGVAHIPATGAPPPRVPQPVTTFTSESDVPHAMLEQADGKIVIVGQAANLGTNPDFAIARYDASGLALDAGFGTGGKLMLDFFGKRDSAEAVVQQPDGKLIVGGFARSGTQNVFALVRLAQ